MKPYLKPCFKLDSFLKLVICLMQVSSESYADLSPMRAIQTVWSSLLDLAALEQLHKLYIYTSTQVNGQDPASGELC